MSKYLLLSLILIVNINAITLKELIKSGLNNNLNLKASKLDIKIKDKNYKEVKNIYNPKINIGFNYNKLDVENRTTQIGDMINGYVNLTVNLYDGGKNKALKEQKKLFYNNSKLNYKLSKKEIILNIITLYYQIKSNDKNIKIYKTKENLLMSEYKRIWNKFKAKMVTSDEVLKLKSEYENNKYLLAEMKYKQQELLSDLYILTNLKNIKITDNYIIPFNNIKYTDNENIKILNNNITVENKNLDIVNSIKKPQIKLNETFGIYSYDDYNRNLLKELPDYQNQLILTLTYNIYDTSTKHKKEAVELTKLKLKTELNNKKMENLEKFKLIIRKLKIDKYKIHSTKTALNMSKKVFNIIKDKYNNGLVDNITYLDALNKLIQNRSLYNISLYNYEIDKFYYYYYSGNNLKKLINILKF